jgi:hypothetical protein
MFPDAQFASESRCYFSRSFPSWVLHVSLCRIGPNSMRSSVVGIFSVSRRGLGGLHASCRSFAFFLMQEADLIPVCKREGPEAREG